MTQALIDEWKHAKEQEIIWNAKRVEIESKIYEHNQANIHDKGTYTTEEGMKITTGFSDEWSQDDVNRAYQQWPEDVKFPFIGTWKPDGKAIAHFRDNQPSLYALLQPALTLKPKKPSFNLK